MKILDGLAKAALFTAVPAFLVYGLLALYWPTIYLTTPLLLPFVPYFDEVHWLTEVAYLLLIGGVSGFFAHSRSWARSIGIFVAVCVCGALIAHITLNALGYEYFMETP